VTFRINAMTYGCCPCGPPSTFRDRASGIGYPRPRKCADPPPLLSRGRQQRNQAVLLPSDKVPPSPFSLPPHLQDIIGPQKTLIARGSSPTGLFRPVFVPVFFLMRIHKDLRTLIPTRATGANVDAPARETSLIRLTPDRPSRSFLSDRPLFGRFYLKSFVLLPAPLTSHLVATPGMATQSPSGFFRPRPPFPPPFFSLRFCSFMRRPPLIAPEPTGHYFFQPGSSGPTCIFFAPRHLFPPEPRLDLL